MRSFVVVATAALVLASLPGVARATNPRNWSPNPDISGNITAPQGGAVINFGDTINCAVSATDRDTWTQGGNSGTEADTVSHYQWSATDINGSALPDTFANSASASTTWTAPATPGDYILRCTLDDPEGDRVSPPDTGSRDDDPPITVQVTVTVIRVEILRNGAPITPENDKVLPGQLNSMTIDSGGLDQSGWQWSGTGLTIRNFTYSGPGTDPDRNFGRADPVTNYNSRSFNFYYAQGFDERETVSCYLTVNGNPITVSASLAVKPPDVPENTLFNRWGTDDNGDVRFDPLPPATPTIVGLLPSNSPPADEDGIEWGALVTIPEGWPQGGLVATAQLVTPRRHFFTNDGVRIRHKRNGSEGHDGDFPIQDNPLPTFSAGDAPRSPLGGNIVRTTVGTPGAAGVEEPEQFQTYLMFKPVGEDSIWVPLRQFLWSWRADAVLEGNEWLLRTPSKYKTDWLTIIGHPAWQFAVVIRDEDFEEY